MTTLILIRHGETDWNVEGRYQGQADPPLNSRGIEQSRRLAARLQTERLDVVYSSPLSRALQTARIISAKARIPLHSDPRLMEIHQGDWQTRLRAEISRLYPVLFARWETDPWNTTPPGGEHLQEVAARVDAVLEDILATHDGRRIGLVTHRIPIVMIKLRYQDLDSDIVRSLEIPNLYWEAIEVPPTLKGE